MSKYGRDKYVLAEDLGRGPILDSEFDAEEGSSEGELSSLGVPRCLGCFFFSCKCSSGLRDKNLLDDPSEEGYDCE